MKMGEMPTGCGICGGQHLTNEHTYCTIVEPFVEKHIGLGYLGYNEDQEQSLRNFSDEFYTANQSVLELEKQGSAGKDPLYEKERLTTHVLSRFEKTLDLVKSVIDWEGDRHSETQQLKRGELSKERLQQGEIIKTSAYQLADSINSAASSLGRFYEMATTKTDAIDKGPLQTIDEAGLQQAAIRMLESENLLDAIKEKITKPLLIDLLKTKYRQAFNKLLKEQGFSPRESNVGQLLDDIADYVTAIIGPTSYDEERSWGNKYRHMRLQTYAKLAQSLLEDVAVQEANQRIRMAIHENQSLAALRGWVNIRGRLWDFKDNFPGVNAGDLERYGPLRAVDIIKIVTECKHALNDLVTHPLPTDDELKRIF